MGEGSFYRCSNCGWTGDHDDLKWGFPVDVHDHYEPSDLADGGGVETCPDCDHAVFTTDAD